MQIFKNILSQKCPRCHKGEIFQYKWYHILHTTKLKDNCPVCGQRTQLEPGFYHGTGYVSYALTVGFLIISFAIWSLITGAGFGDSRVFYWLGVNVVLLIILMPWFMRISRIIWLTAFFRSDDHLYEINENRNVACKTNI